MPYRLPDDFPSKLSDEELEAVVASIVAAMRDRYPDDVGSWLPELQLALVSVAVSEQARRQLVGGSRIAIGSLVVAAVALAVAVIALFVA